MPRSVGRIFPAGEIIQWSRRVQGVRHGNPGPRPDLTAVRDHYADAARAVEATSCCAAPGTTTGLIGGTLYGEDDTGVLPGAAVAASLGCGNPTMLADLAPAVPGPSISGV